LSIPRENPPFHDLFCQAVKFTVDLFFIHINIHMSYVRICILCASAMVGMPKLNGRCTQGGLWLKDLAMRDGSAGTPFCPHQAADERGTAKPVYK
jgi:hypothetical protein